MSLTRIAEAASVFGLRPDFTHTPEFDEEVSWSCANGHTYRLSWSKQRNKGCKECGGKIPFGEILLRALCRHYWPEGEWEKLRLRGLDPSDPQLRLEFDLCSHKLKILFENQSEYHAGKGPSRFYDNVTAEELARRDNLKVLATRAGGMLYDYKFMPVWLEAANAQKIIREAAKHCKRPINAIVDQFENWLNEAGIYLPDSAVPTSSELYSAFSDREWIQEELQTNGLALSDDAWLGRDKLHVVCQTPSCGHRWITSYTQLARAWKRGSSGCAVCWSRRRKEGTWSDFIDLCRSNGIEVASAGPVPAGESVIIALSGEQLVRTRSYVQDKLVKQLPVFGAWTNELGRRRAYTSEIMRRNAALLDSFGIELQSEERPITQKVGNKVQATMFKLFFRKCKHSQDVALGPFLQKLKSSQLRQLEGQHGLCPTCLKEAEYEARLGWIKRAAEVYGLTLVSGNHRDAKAALIFECKGRCDRGRWTASWDNLAKRGVTCSKCKQSIGTSSDVSAALEPAPRRRHRPKGQSQ